jgi:hypothetical protein
MSDELAHRSASAQARTSTPGAQRRLLIETDLHELGRTRD